MNRAIWFVAGTSAGVYVMVKARRAAEALTPEGLGDRLAGLGVGVHLFAEEVRAGRAEKETELRQRLGLTLDERPALTSGRETLAGARLETGAGAPSSTQGSSTTDSQEDR